MKWLQKKQIVLGFPARDTTKFLWLPKLVANEWRWLEKASWHEQYTSCVRGNRVWKEWRAIAWIDEFAPDGYLRS